MNLAIRNNSAKDSAFNSLYNSYDTAHDVLNCDILSAGYSSNVISRALISACGYKRLFSRDP